MANDLLCEQKVNQATYVTQAREETRSFRYRN